jgi:hypothetical protein
VVLALAAGRTPESTPVVLLEWDATDALALRVRNAPDRLATAGLDGLEVRPEGAALELVLSTADGAGTAAAPARALAVVTGVTGVPPPEIAPERNGWEPLAETWTRDPRGTWRAHGAWALDAPLPPARDDVAPHGSPPGWLASALPPGRGVLLARTAGGTWLRGLGFDAGRRGDAAGD